MAETTIAMVESVVVVQQQQQGDASGTVVVTEYQLHIRGLFDSHFNFFRTLRPTLRDAPSEGWAARPVEVIASMSGWPMQKLIEAAGKPYEELLRSGQAAYFGVRYKASAAAPKAEEEEEVAEEDDQAEDEGADEYKRKKKSMIITDDYYEILGLGDKRWRSTPKDIKDAYRKMVLMYHPDKNKEVTDEAFKKVQKAYDTLSDDRKKRIYDSQEDTDVRIPTKVEADDFYTTFRPIFERFAKYSVATTVPSIGDDKTPIEKVNRFYSFWTAFKSWRDFSYLDEYDLNDAECREEKRWMDRQNKRKRDKKKREEKAKINKLIEIAYSLDPRIIKWKKDIEEEKRQARLAREEAARKKQEELERQAEEERLKKEAEEKAKQEEALRLKKEKERNQKAVKRNRTRLRTLVKEKGSTVPIPTENVERVCAESNLQKLQTLCKALEQANANSNLQEFIDIFNQEHSTIVEAKAKEEEEKRKAQEEKEASQKQTTATTSSRSKETRPWSEDELSLLSRALVRFPGGMSDRWQRVADFIETRTVAEVIAKTQEAKQNKPTEMKKTQTQAVNDAYHRFKKTTKDVHIDSNLSQRFEGDLDPEPQPKDEDDDDDDDGPSIPVVVPTPTASPAPSPASTHAKAAPAASTPKTATPKAATPKAATPKAETPKAATPKAATPKASTPKSEATTPTTPAAATPSPVASPSSEWSIEQQKQLEAALAKYPSSLGTERWEKIATDVTGKTKKDCILRFKYLAELVKSKGKK